VVAEIGVVELLYLCMTNVWHKIICKGLAEKKTENLLIFVKIVES
jgi:hypothetical protein